MRMAKTRARVVQQAYQRHVNSNNNMKKGRVELALISVEKERALHLTLFLLSV